MTTSTRLYRLDTANTFTNIIFVDHARALASTLSTNARIREEDEFFGDVLSSLTPELTCNIYWTMESDAEIVARYESNCYPNVTIIND